MPRWYWTIVLHGRLAALSVEEGQRALVQAAPVEDPAEGVGDTRVPRRQLRGGLGEGERLVLVAAVLGEDRASSMAGCAAPDLMFRSARSSTASANLGAMVTASFSSVFACCGLPAWRCASASWRRTGPAAAYRRAARWRSPRS